MYSDELYINLGQQCHIVQLVKEDYVLLSLLRIGFAIHVQSSRARHKFVACLRRSCLF